jgi:pimeloyl-ACP methyl ester carboxylesterase
VLAERYVRVAEDPAVELFVAETVPARPHTLLVIHGGPDWDQTYLHDPLVRLGDERRVVFVDLRGCGRSTRGLPSRAYTPDHATHDLIRIVKAIGDAPVDVLGFSYGGLIAQRLTLTAPERVRRLVVASSSVLPLPPDAFEGWAERDRRLAAQHPDEAAGYWGEEQVRREALDSAPANVWNLDRLPGYLGRLEKVSFSADWSRSWADGSLPPARVDDAAGALARLGKPLFLLHGRQDMTFPVGLVEPTLRAIPSASACVIEEAGHMAHVDQPDEWLGALAAFLRTPVAAEPSW